MDLPVSFRSKLFYRTNPRSYRSNVTVLCYAMPICRARAYRFHAMFKRSVAVSYQARFASLIMERKRVIRACLVNSGMTSPNLSAFMPRIATPMYRHTLCVIHFALPYIKWPSDIVTKQSPCQSRDYLMPYERIDCEFGECVSLFPSLPTGVSHFPEVIKSLDPAFYSEPNGYQGMWQWRWLILPLHLNLSYRY